MIPDLSAVVALHEVPLQYKRVTTEAVDFEKVETVEDVVAFFGTCVPMKPQRVDRKPEGQRRWRWKELVTETDIPLDSAVQDVDAVQYRIDSKEPWQPSGFFKYDLVEQPDGLDL